MRRYPIPVVSDSATLNALACSQEKIYYLALKKDYDNASEALRNAATMLETGYIGSKKIYLLVNKTGNGT
jgi:hypothetical protein